MHKISETFMFKNYANILDRSYKYVHNGEGYCI